MQQQRVVQNERGVWTAGAVWPLRSALLLQRNMHEGQGRAGRARQKWSRPGAASPGGVCRTECACYGGLGLEWMDLGLGVLG